MEDYYAIAREIDGVLHEDRGSRFLGYAKELSTQEEFGHWLAQLKKDHPKANHHCFAYRLVEGRVFRNSDDGEPGNSAGAPILNRIESADLWNCGVVVVRYFGGVKLGVGGLIRAYGTTAQMALEQAGKLKKETQAFVSITFAYADTAHIERLIQSQKLLILDKTFEQICTYQLAIPLSGLDKFTAALEAIEHQSAEKIFYTRK